MEQERLVLLWSAALVRWRLCAGVDAGAGSGGGATRTAVEREAIYKEIDALYEAHEYVEPCEVNLCLCSHIRFVSRQG
jgi:hypothetical protein